MSVSNKVKDFISQLENDGETLFPYLANNNWKLVILSIILVLTGTIANQQQQSQPCCKGSGCLLVKK